RRAVHRRGGGVGAAAGARGGSSRNLGRAKGDTCGADRPQVEKRRPCGPPFAGLPAPGRAHQKTLMYDALSLKLPKFGRLRLTVTQTPPPLACSQIRARVRPWTRTDEATSFQPRLERLFTRSPSAKQRCAPP